MKHWYFWILAPLMLGMGFVLPLIVVPPTWQGYVALYVLCGALVLAALALSAPRRFGWSVKAVAAVVLLVCVEYTATEALEWWHGKPFGFGAERAQANLFNALRSLVAFGVPSIYLLLTGRSRASIDVLLDVEENRAAEAGNDDADKQRDPTDGVSENTW